MDFELPAYLKLLLSLVALLAFWASYRGVSTGRLRELATSEVFGEERPGDAGRRITETELERLPLPVQRWLRWAGVVGQPELHSVKLRQTGRFRLGADKPWLPFAAEQVYSLSPPQFAWFVRMRLGGLPLLSGWDWFIGGQGNLHMEVAGLATVADARSAELDQGELMRWLSEIIWFPQAALARCVTWEAVDENKARATAHSGGMAVNGLFHFGAEGQPLNFTAQRYCGFGAQPTLERWETPATAWAAYSPGPGWSSVRIPSEGYVEWQLATGPLRYADVRIVELSYNPSLGPTRRRVGG